MGRARIRFSTLTLPEVFNYDGSTPVSDIVNSALEYSFNLPEDTKVIEAHFTVVCDLDKPVVVDKSNLGLEIIVHSAEFPETVDGIPVLLVSEPADGRTA